MAAAIHQTTCSEYLPVIVLVISAPGANLLLTRRSKSKIMRSETPTITLSATPKGNGYQATVTFSDGISMSSAETFPTIAEAMTAAALKLLDMRERLEALDHLQTSMTP